MDRLRALDAQSSVLDEFAVRTVSVLNNVTQGRSFRYDLDLANLSRTALPIIRMTYL